MGSVGEDAGIIIKTTVPLSFGTVIAPMNLPPDTTDILLPAYLARLENVLFHILG
jgi:hypothetical protein